MPPFGLRRNRRDGRTVDNSACLAAGDRSATVSVSHSLRSSDVCRRMSESQSRRAVRTNEPSRAQGVIHFEMPEGLLPSHHRARPLWKVVQTLDLSAFTQAAKALE